MVLPEPRATPEPAARPFADVFPGESELAGLMRAFDWAATPLGPVDRWPQALKTCLRIMLTSRQPMWLGWGEALTFLYNDAYRAILGGKHPWALGRPTAAVWSEIWDDIAPRIEATLGGEAGTYDEALLLIMERHGYQEETYYTFSYSPVPDDTGGVGGLFCANTDDTRRVIGERQVALLRDLAARTADARTTADACARAAASLASDAADLPFALLYVIEPEQQRATLAGAAGIPANHPAAPASLPLSTDAVWPVADAAESGVSRLISDLTGFGALPGGPWPRPPSAAVVMPIVPAGERGRAAVLIAALNPLRPLDDDYRGFLDLVAGEIGAALSNAQAYEAERERAEALAALDRAKTAFFSEVSHEFRTPLTLLLGPLGDVLDGLQGDLPDAARHELEVARRNALRLNKLVNTLLDFARIEAGRIEAVYEPIDLATLTADLASVFRAAIERAGLRFVVDCPPLPAPIYIDREMWEKVLFNLLSNAFKFTLQGAIAVRLRWTGDAAELQVADTGAGIPPEELPHLFERFHRVRGTRARTQEGSGIGLALVQELVQLHGGTVTVASRPDAGTTFAVRIPAGTAHLPADRLGAPRTLVSTSLGASAYVEEAARWQGGDEQATLAAIVRDAAPDGLSGGLGAGDARILLADDNTDMREYVARLLSGRWQVQAVGDGQAALEAALAQPPDLVLADVMMPRLDGFGLLRALRADPRTARVPVMLLSARAGEEARVEGLNAGADDYLVKPFSARELIARVGAHLELARVRQQTAEALRLNEERLRLATRVAGMYAWEVDLTTHLETVSDNYGEVLGFSTLDYPMPREAATMLYCHPDDVPLVEAAFAAVGAVERDLHVEWRFCNPETGEIRWIESRGIVLTDEQGQPQRIVGVAQNISARKQAEQTLREQMQAQLALNAVLRETAAARDRALAETEAALRVRGEFLSALSHDLRTPLTTVRGLLDLSVRQARRLGVPEVDRIADRLELASRAAGRIAAMLTGVLDLTRLESGRALELEYAPFDLAALLRQLVAEQQHASPLHDFVLDAPPTLPGVWDAARLERVLGNLLGNAVKYSPDGGAVRVTLAEERRSDDRWAVLTVSDEGIGIPAVDLPRLFERFHRGSNVVGRIAGVGVGLAAAKQIVDQHGGTIAFTSSEGQGTTVTVSLPCTPPAVSEAVEATAT